MGRDAGSFRYDILRMPGVAVAAKLHTILSLSVCMLCRVVVARIIK